MKFYSWEKNEPLLVNNYGLLEPVSSLERRAPNNDDTTY